ncbi:MAG: DMT family transporter [Alphaproteobacteria bacterium]|nr:DMT family transporter [Alphaproteobacteria bacterium]
MPRLLALLRSPYFLMVLPPLFWAGNAIVGRAVVGEIPPIALSFWRWSLGLAILLPFGLPRLLPEMGIVRRRWPLLVALAVTSVSAYNSFLYVAVQTTTAINATLVGTSLPVVTMLLSWLWLGERGSWRQTAGMAVSLGGVVLVIAQGDPAGLLALEGRPGDLWMLAATVCWAVYSVLLRRHPPGMDPIALLTALIAIGLVFITPFYLYELATGPGFAVTPRSLAVLGYVATFPSLLAYYFWNRGVAVLGAGLTSQYTYLVPVFAAGLATVLLGEEFRWFHAAGLLLIFSGIWWAGRR